MGRLLEALDQSDQLDRTFVVFTSDQGFAWGQHGFAWNIAPYDANMRVPFIVRLPGRVVRGEVCEHPVAAIDLVPTFFALAETPLPWKVHGHDLSPLFRNPGADWPYPVLLEHFCTEFGPQTDCARGGDDIVFGVPWWLFLRQRRYKYIRTLEEDEIEELYDLESDPQELLNLALDSGHQRTLRDYRQRLLAELQRTDAGLVNSLPELRVVHRPRVP